jgi:hypothetical protein
MEGASRTSIRSRSMIKISGGDRDEALIASTGMTGRESMLNIVTTMVHALIFSVAYLVLKHLSTEGRLK